MSTLHKRAPPPPKCVEVVRLVVVVRGRDKVPEKVTSSSESEGLKTSSASERCSIRVNGEGGKVRVNDL